MTHQRDPSHHHPEANLEHLRRFALSERDHLVSVDDFCSLPDPSESFSVFLDSLPSVLAAEDFQTVCERVVRAHRRENLVGWAMGAHVIKTGCTPILQDLLERGILGMIMIHGASAIHDYELALIGETSEDVKNNIETGDFGMWKETAEGFSRACTLAMKEGLGLGEAYGELILREDELDESVSVLATARQLNVPVTIHLAMGTDITHMHPDFDPAEAGEATMRDFRIACEKMKDLQEGVWLNVGSAVLMPEIFLKAVSVARNLGHALDSFLAVNFDMIQHYRPTRNVVERPAPEGISITGHHEMLLPLFRLGILSGLKAERS